MACAPTDIACQVTQGIVNGILIPIVLPLFLLLAILVVAYFFHGKKVRAAMFLAFVVWSLYYVAPWFGFPQFHAWLAAVFDSLRRGIG